MITCPNCSTPVEENELIPAGNTQVCPHCRDLYLQRMKEGLPARADSDARAVREQYLKHEASVKSIGFLYLLGSVFLIVSAVVMLIAGGFNGEGLTFFIIMTAVYCGLGTLMFFMGLGIRKLRRWVRIPATILAGLGVLNIPIGTLINGYILYLIWSQKGKMVFSEEYAEVIAATPDMKYKTSLAAKILLGLLLAVLIAALVGIFLAD